MRKTKIVRTILVIIIFIWAYLVFTFSSQDGNDSSGLSRRVVEFFIKDQAIVDIVEPYVRKVAHFSEYAIGGALFICLFSTYEWSDKRKITTGIFVGVWYAALDEIHQLMVPGRTGSIVDVYIDTLGISAGVVGMMIIFKIIEILKNKKKLKKA